MKFLVALAFVAVANAATVPEPVQLPKAPVPQVQPAMAQIHAIDFRPLIVPAEVIEALNARALEAPDSVQDTHIDAVRIIENPEDYITDIKIVDIPEVQVDSVKIVDAPVAEADAAVPQTFFHPIKIYPNGLLR